MKSVLCLIFGHKYRVVAKPVEAWGDGIRWLRCGRCRREFFMNARVRAIVPWDAELEDMHTWEKIR